MPPYVSKPKTENKILKDLYDITKFPNDRNRKKCKSSLQAQKN